MATSKRGEKVKLSMADDIGNVVKELASGLKQGEAFLKASMTSIQNAIGSFSKRIDSVIGMQDVKLQAPDSSPVVSGFKRTSTAIELEMEQLEEVLSKKQQSIEGTLNQVYGPKKTDQAVEKLIIQRKLVESLQSKLASLKVEYDKVYSKELLDQIDTLNEKIKVAGEMTVSTGLNKTVDKYKKELAGLQDKYNALNQTTPTYTKLQKEVQVENAKTADSFKLVNFAAISVLRRISKSLIDTFKTLTSAGSMLTETNITFLRILGDLSGEGLRISKEIADAFAINETQVKNSILKVYNLAKTSGVAADESLRMARSINILGSELATVWGTSSEQAVNALISALQGLPRPLKGYGIFTQTAEVIGYLKEAGLVADDFAGSLTQDQRVMGTFLKILSDAGYSIGSFSERFSAVDKQVQILNATMETLQQNLGSMLNSVIGPLLETFNPLLKYISEITGQIAKLPEPIKLAIGAFMAFTLITPIVLIAFVLFARGFAIIKKEILAMNISLNVFNSQITLSGATIMTKFLPAVMKTALWISVIILFVASLAKQFGWFEKTVDSTNSTIKETEKSSESLKRTLAGFDDINVFKLDTRTEELIDLESATAIANESEKLIKGSLTELMTGFEDLNTVVLAVTGSVLLLGLAKNWTAIANGFKLITGNPAMLVWLAAAVALLGTVYNLITNWDTMSGAQKIVGTIAAITSAVLMLVAALVYFKVIQSSISVGGLFTMAALAGAAGIIATMNSGVKSAGSDIPKMAKGGIVGNSTIAEIGEGLYPEAVIPLGTSPQFRDMKADIAKAVIDGIARSGLGVNNQVNVQVNVDENYIYKSYNNRYKMMGGIT